MTPFAGYDMPVFYSGIYEEVNAVRSACGMFDVSHMARFEFAVSQETTLRKLLTCDVSAIKPGRGAYGLILNSEGGILDDVILFRRPAGDFFLVVNASNHANISEWVRANAGIFINSTADTAMIAVQGPDAEKIVSTAFSPAFSKLPYFGIHSIDGILTSRTGYTGEDGFELTLNSDRAESAWETLRSAGATPCGLGARDVLRIEAGYSLYGMDMDETVSPYECGLGFAVTSPDNFIGADSLKSRPIQTKMIGLDAGNNPSAILRHGYSIFSGGKAQGRVTSGTFSRTLMKSIAFGIVPPDISSSAELHVDVRGRIVPVQRVSRRFVSGRVKSREKVSGGA